VSAPARLAGFAALLAAVFGVAAFAGAAIGPDRESASKPVTGSESEGHGMDPKSEGAEPVRGLAVADGDLKLALMTREVKRGRRSELRFTILGRREAPVRDFDLEHERRMHLIVVRRDGSGFQHLHPELGGEGVWSVPLTLPEAGSYRVFADFSHEGEARTLAADLTVDGDADYGPLPEPATRSSAGDGYEVRLEGAPVHAGEEAELNFTVTRHDERVRPEPYLGARGHLVALREGDLAFLHVHPDEDSLAFMAEFPTEARYRLYLQFKHEGRVRTAEFTKDVSP
jgi:hypothetical protein